MAYHRQQLVAMDISINRIPAMKTECIDNSWPFMTQGK